MSAPLAVRRGEFLRFVFDFLFQRFVNLRAEEALHDFLPFFRVRQKEPPEFALREKDDLPELAHAHAEEFLHRGVCIFRRDEPLPGLIQLVEFRFRLLFHEPVGFPLALAHLLRTAPHAVGFLPEGEVEGDLREGVRPGVAAPQVRAAPFAAAGVPVKGVAHGVENGGFPRAGGAADEKEPVRAETSEVQHGPAHVGPESRECQSQRSHACSASFRTPSRNSFSSSVRLRP